MTSIHSDRTHRRAVKVRGPLIPEFHIRVQLRNFDGSYPKLDTRGDHLSIGLQKTPLRVTKVFEDACIKTEWPHLVGQNNVHLFREFCLERGSLQETDPIC